MPCLEERWYCLTDEIRRDAHGRQNPYSAHVLICRALAAVDETRRKRMERQQAELGGAQQASIFRLQGEEGNIMEGSRVPVFSKNRYRFLFSLVSAMRG